MAHEHSHGSGADTSHPREWGHSMDLPVACTLSPEAQKARREGLLSGLIRRANLRESTPGGYRLRFAAAEGTLAAIARTMREPGEALTRG
jgi:hypothetical protein